MRQNIVIVDYGMGNLRSVQKAFNRMSVECEVTSDKSKISEAQKLVLPGVGHFKYGMNKLTELKLLDVLNEKVIEQKTPILGICLGAQLFTKHSQEGDCDGMNWIDAEVEKFYVSDKIRYKIPHIGWNNVSIRNHNRLDKSIKTEDHFYFVHSYHLKCEDKSDIWMTTNYDYEFVSAVRRENIFGTQFHPEKSQDAGMQLIKNFANM